MQTRRIVLHGQTRKKLRRVARKCRDADTRVRYVIVLRTADGSSGKRIAKALGCSPSTVSRTLARWDGYGEAGLVDRREDNGGRKADDLFADAVRGILASGPREFLHRRPTWTLALLVETARQYTGVSVSVTTMGRLLRRMKVRRGRAKPDAPCPWSRAARERCVAAIRGLIDALPPTEACVWEDEADVHLNPKIVLDWMLPGTQRRVMTPGKNKKRYIAGAMDAKTDRVVWVTAGRKDTRLFLDLLARFLAEYPDREVIHVVLDNYCIHGSKQTKLWLAEHGSKFRLHFLPRLDRARRGPYDPDDNRIERKLWREVHANVTVNHTCRTIDELMGEVAYYLTSYNRRIRKKAA